MINSMTGYARQQHLITDKLQVTIEIRSVNHRYLELSLRLPDALGPIEQRLRNLIKARMQRGKVDCSIKLNENEDQQAGLSLNQPLITSLLTQCATLQQQISHPSPFSALDLLRWPGVITRTEALNESVHESLVRAFEITLDDFCASRQREGAQLKGLIQERLASMRHHIRQVQRRLPEITQLYRQKLLQRLAELKLDLQQERIEQEVLLLAQKIDISEEVDRISAHCNEIEHILDTGSAIGRRLDFLMQELNRESNTLASKSNHIDNTRAAIELKVLIEQMREQIQNIE